MIEKLTQWVFGTAEARVTGDTARFLNVAVHSGVRPLDVQKEGDALLLKVRARQFRALHAVKTRCGGGVRLLRRGGAPFLLLRMRRRPGLVLGAVLGVALYSFLSGFYWGVGIEGESPYAASEILEAARESGVYFGASRKALDIGRANHRLEEKLPRLSYVSVNTSGCFLTVRVHAALEEIPADDAGGAYNVVAKREGLVREIVAERGTVTAEAGSFVTAGEVLVSAVRTIGDPWGEAPLRNLYTHARARVLAETFHTFTASCPLHVDAKRETVLGERRALSVFGVKIPLSFSGAPAGEISSLQKTPLILLGKTLPVWVETLRTAETRTVPVDLTESEAKARAEIRLEALLENALGETGKVLEKTVSSETRDGAVYVTANCTLLEDIAREVPLTADERAAAEEKLLQPPE